VLADLGLTRGGSLQDLSELSELAGIQRLVSDTAMGLCAIPGCPVAGSPLGSPGAPGTTCGSILETKPEFDLQRLRMSLSRVVASLGRT
jgi:hypothetical protein